MLLLRALTAFVLLPGVVAFLMPLTFVSFDPWRNEAYWPGAFIVLLGMLLLLWCVRDFYVAGRGTLAPWHPPRHLVVVGLYRYIRNPMYVAVLTLLAGWAIFFLSPFLTGYMLMFAMAFHIRVVRYEEPWLEKTFGEEWLQYRESVGRWLPGQAG